MQNPHKWHFSFGTFRKKLYLCNCKGFENKYIMAKEKIKQKGMQLTGSRLIIPMPRNILMQQKLNLENYEKNK